MTDLQLCLETSNIFFAIA